MRFGYPIMLDLSGRAVVIVGGGGVAVRKAKGVLDAGVVSVTVVSPEFHPELPTDVIRVAEQYDPKHLAGAGLVFAATNVNSVNDAVVADCNARNIWVSRADTDEDLPGDFATPALLRKGAGDGRHLGRPCSAVGKDSRWPDQPMGRLLDNGRRRDENASA